VEYKGRSPDDVAVGADGDVIDVAASVANGHAVKDSPTGRQEVEASGDGEFSEDALVSAMRLRWQPRRGAAPRRISGWGLDYALELFQQCVSWRAIS
jgi:hypothetical protein